MLGLTLRSEFQGRLLKGTAIDLSAATKGQAADFLRITYPTMDVLRTIEATSKEQGRPVILIGERGQGKSHILAALCHVLSDNDAATKWLGHWAQVSHNSKIASIPIRNGMHVISESMYQHQYKHLWDLLFARHPHGAHCRGMWEGLGESKTNIPSQKILMEMFTHTPTALILDEYQTWYDGLVDTEQTPSKTWAFNFIQLLSEIAKEHPDKLVLVVSVRNGRSDAYLQIHRVGPVIVDFKGPEAKQDRLQLLLHRLFENRMQVPRDQIGQESATHISEYIRLFNIPATEQDRVHREFLDAWPFAPHLIQLLEDQVLVATHAQETRDLIRILADLYKRVGKKTPIITAADFNIDDHEGSSINALLDSVANQHHVKLREKAFRNLDAVKSAAASTGQPTPHASEIISALWLRSLAPMNQAGADQQTLHVDITRSHSVDDNAFHLELSTIVENSFNIHAEEDRYIFRETENPQAKLIASARNDKLFLSDEDTIQLVLETRYALTRDDTGLASKYRIIVLPKKWKSDPWTEVPEADQPSRWDDRLPLLVVPEPSADMDADLGVWLRNHLQNNRNAVRFLLPKEGTGNIFLDRELLILARCIHLAKAWKGQNPEYGKLMSKYQKEIQSILKVHFPRFAVLRKWNYQEPKSCRFHIENHRAEGVQIPEAIDTQIRENLFIPEDFAEMALASAENNDSVGKFIRELREPRAGGDECIPWLGETSAKEQLIRLCAQGKIAINLRGLEYLQRHDGETEDIAWKRMRGKLGTGKHLDETYLLLPQNVPATGGVDKPESASEADSSNPPPLGGTPSSPNEGESSAAQSGGSATGSVGLFDNPVSFSPLSAPSTSSINLLGKLESWRINPGTQIRALSLKIDQLTGAQLQEMIRKLPDGITYELELEREDG